VKSHTNLDSDYKKALTAVRLNGAPIITLVGRDELRAAIDEHESSAGATPASSPDTSRPGTTREPTISPELADKGLISATSYRSPHFGFTVDWDESWILDQQFGPPLVSGADKDGLYLKSAKMHFVLVQVYGLPVADAFSLDRELSLITSVDFLGPLSANNDYTNLLSEQHEGYGGVVVHYTDAYGAQHVYMVESFLMNDGKTIARVYFATTLSQFEEMYEKTHDTVHLNGEPLLGVFDIAEIVAAIEENQSTPGAAE
jgi:hypothetical protein